ncbi:MAG: penicillin-binding protein 2 [Candidatus Moranbacteria bacterium]|nr:penicillin-binding protein 2 [Candidatus Moranbacteria bacterium]
MRDKIKRSMVEIDDPIIDKFSKSENKQVFKSDSKWFNFLWAISCLTLFFLAGRVFYLTIVQGDYYSEIAGGQSVRSVPIIAARGEIFDKNGKVLAKNVPNQSVIIIPENLPSENSQREEIAKILSEKTSLEYDQTLVKINLSDETEKSLILAENISHEESLIISGLGQDVSGIAIQNTALREYSDGILFSHIIGYEGLIQKEEWENEVDYLLTDRIGKTGIETYYEKSLRGGHGSTQSMVNSRGELVRKLSDIPAKKGSNVYLNIDSELQKVIIESLEKQLERADTQKATAIAMNPKTGAILAMVSLPSYDNNLFARGIEASEYNSLISNKNNPLFNRSISGAYPPGSTVKPVEALAILQEKIISPDYEIESKGGIKVGNSFFGDWKVHGFTDMRRAIAVSSDVYFYTACGGHENYPDIQGLGIEKMKKYMQQFGYGKKTGIDLFGEVAGVYPDKEWKKNKINEKWYLGDTYNSSIGQGYITATPLQVLNSISVIANGGILYKPQIVSHIIDVEENEQKFEPVILKNDIASKTDIKVAQEGMRQAISDGTATMLKDLSVEVAGKTGTAQFGKRGNDRVHSWFVSYAPYDDPEIALVVMVEDQTDRISSSTVPVAYDVYKWYFGEEEKSEDK